MSLSMWQIMEPSFNQPGRIGELSRLTVTVRDQRRGGFRPFEQVTGRHLSTFDWLTEFHISLGNVAFTPQRMNQSQGQSRSRMIQIFRASSLGSQIQQRLIIPTVAPVGRDTRGREHDAYIFEPGNLDDVTRGDPRFIANHPPPAGSRPIGYVHTHPPSPQIQPPTPGSDWLESRTLQAHPTIGFQLMVETGPRRVWGLISPNYAFPLGLMNDAGVLNELVPTSPQAGIIYALR
jgi:hypothetical protein